VVREPQHDRHALTIRRVDVALRPHFGDGWLLAMQLPLALDEMSEPEPDFSIVRGVLAHVRGGHPRHAALIVEVAESSLALDRGARSRGPGETIAPVAAPAARIRVADLLP
jgi:hypothetical protein